MPSWRLIFDCDPGPGGKGLERVVVVKADGEQCVIGRGQDVDVRCHSNAISRKHCAVTIVSGAAHLEDLGSSGGTFFNRMKIRRVALSPGDTFFPGQPKVTLVSVEPA
jgi:pSer/pThr/pTyr-binding forkhead associated (FHA) protein